MVNIETCSMGGIIDYGVSVGTKSSPHSLAIEKVQDDLRQEFDVREERRRELEFLEKGGNPLDFKFDHVESVSVQSTSLTDQIAEQNVTSEAKGSFVFTASPCGDSVESSGKPGSSLCRETNTADNLMLFGGENDDVVEEKLVKRGTKRTNAAQAKQSFPTDGNSNEKKTEDYVLSRLGVKNQAYVRRNRSKPSREIASIKHPVGSAKGSEPNDTKGVIQEKQADDHAALLSVSGLKQAGQKCKNETNNTTSDGQVAMELDGIQAIHESHCVVNPNDTNDNQQLDGCGEIAAAAEPVETPDSTSKVVLRTSYSCASTQEERETIDDKKVDNGQLNKSMVHIHAGDLDDSTIIPVCAVKAATLQTNTVDPSCKGTISLIGNHAERNTYQEDVEIVGKSHEDLNSSGRSNKSVNNCGQLEGFISPASVKESCNSEQFEVSTTIHVKDETETCDSAIGAQKDTGRPSPGHSTNNDECLAPERKNSCLGDSNSVNPVVGSALPDCMQSFENYGPNMETEIKKSGGNLNKMAKKEYEDSVLKKACHIEASIKRAGERSLCNISLEKITKGHWDFVLEEMTWMANDFMQERLWKSMAAAQVCHWIASDGRAKFEDASIQRKKRTVTRSLVKGIMSFWRSAEALRTTGGTAVTLEHNSNILGETETKQKNMQGNESLEAEEHRWPHKCQLQGYAVRFFEFNSHTSGSLASAEAPPTPDRLNDFGILKVADHLSKENLFYTVAPGAMLAYRESVESFFVHHKKVGNTGFKDDYEASVCDSATDFPQENAYEEDEGETCYSLPEAYDGSLLSKLGHKKKHLMQQRINGARPYGIGTDVPFEPCLESKSGNQPIFSNGKRPSSFLTIPTKRVRTAARQRIVSPFPAGVGGTTQMTSKTDVSSGDTSSYQDDQSSLHGGSLPWKNMDFESTVDFDKQLPYDGTEVCTKANKKKKLKNPGYKTAQHAVNSCASAAVKGRIYDQRPQVDLITQYDQKDFLKKRADSLQFALNGNNAANGGHASKKLKMMRQGVDTSQEASPVASQMSNMGNPARIIKIVTNRDRGRKVKGLKMTSSGGWSNFEDQALVVLIHDLGQNWELVSDAINSIVQFKSVYRQPKECKDRYKVLVDKSSGDGADSAEDSGSSQHYHFTIPGIPKGSARQLFQRLQGPFEEENLKSHFEKMILHMQQLRPRRRQGNGQELKSIIPLHNSHVVALQQACPNNLSGGTLTPPDLADTTSSNLDSISPASGYKGSHTNGLTPPNHHVSNGPTTPTSNLNSRLPGSPGIVLGSNLPSPSTLSTPSRDAQKYGVPRSNSLQSDEQQKIHNNQMLSSRNLQHPGGSPGAFPAGVDRGTRVMPGAHGTGMVTGLNRGMPASRAGFPRLSSPGMLNMVSPGNVLANNGQGQVVPNAINAHPGATSSPGNSMLRPRDPMQMLRPGQKVEEHMQIVMPEVHTQVSQGSSQAVHFSGTNPSFSNPAASSPVHALPIQQSQHMFGNPRHSQIQGTNHSSPQQQAYAMRLAKERQIQQQRTTPQQHNDLSGASAPTVQNGLQIQQQKQAPATSSVPSSQPQHQRQQAAQNPPDRSTPTNQAANATQHKQKKQQGQQQPRQNQQQRNQGSQQAKLMKSLGRGNMLIPQAPVDTTSASAVSTSSKKQVPEKKLMQQSQEHKAASPSLPQPGNQHKLYTSPLPQSPKQLADISNQGLVQGSPSQTLLASQHLPLHFKSPPTMQQQQGQINPSQNSIQRTIMHENIQTDFDQVQHNQMIPTTPIPQSIDSGSPRLSSISQQKHGASNDLAAVTSTSKLLSSPKDTLVGNETLSPSSNQDVLQRQIADGLPMYDQGIDGQWHQEQSKQQVQSPRQQRPAVQGSVYIPSNSGTG